MVLASFLTNFFNVFRMDQHPATTTVDRADAVLKANYFGDLKLKDLREANHGRHEHWFAASQKSKMPNLVEAEDILNYVIFRETKLYLTPPGIIW